MGVSRVEAPSEARLRGLHTATLLLPLLLSVVSCLRRTPAYESRSHPNSLLLTSWPLERDLIAKYGYIEVQGVGPSTHIWGNRVHRKDRPPTSQPNVSVKALALLLNFEIHWPVPPHIRALKGETIQMDPLPLADHSRLIFQELPEIPGC